MPFRGYVLSKRIGFLFNSINESPLKTPSSNLPTFYFKIGQLLKIDYKKDETKNIA